MAQQKRPNLLVLLSELIRFETTSRNTKENERALAWVKKQLVGLPLHIKQEKSGGYPSLIITTQKTKSPKLWLQAHIDVVNASPEAFKPKKKNGKLYGRGAYDMKFAIASFIKTFHDIGPELKNYDLGIMLTSDEEIGGAHGVEYLLNKGFTSEVAYVPDGGINWIPERLAKGVWYFTATSRGKSAHPSVPWQGENAVFNLMDFVTELRTKFPDEPCKDADHDHNVINLSNFVSVKDSSRVPDWAAADLDIFYNSDVQQRKFHKIVKQLLKKYPKISIETKFDTGCFLSPASGKYFKLFMKIAQEQFGIKPRDGIVSQSSSDARFFAARKIPTIVVRPKGDGHHGNEEWIDMRDFERFCDATTEFAKQASIIK
ncbi:M20 family metallopeptidase [Patescibacteria group bacterium]